MELTQKCIEITTENMVVQVAIWLVHKYLESFRKIAEPTVENGLKCLQNAHREHRANIFAVFLPMMGCQKMNKIL